MPRILENAFVVPVLFIAFIAGVSLGWAMSARLTGIDYRASDATADRAITNARDDTDRAMVSHDTTHAAVDDAVGKAVESSRNISTTANQLTGSIEASVQALAAARNSNSRVVTDIAGDADIAQSITALLAVRTDGNRGPENDVRKNP